MQGVGTCTLLPTALPGVPKYLSTPKEQLRFLLPTLVRELIDSERPQVPY